MKKRWKDRIQILVRSVQTYDKWGHSSVETWTETEDVWADVRPQLNSKSAVRVIVRAPFDYTENTCIQWNNRLWKTVHDPIYFPETQLIQFIIEPL